MRWDEYLCAYGGWGLSANADDSRRSRAAVAGRLPACYSPLCGVTAPRGEDAWAKLATIYLGLRRHHALPAGGGGGDAALLRRGLRQPVRSLPPEPAGAAGAGRGARDRWRRAGLRGARDHLHQRRQRGRQSGAQGRRLARRADRGAATIHHLGRRASRRAARRRRAGRRRASASPTCRSMRDGLRRRPRRSRRRSRPDTALVSVMLANNEVGTIQPLAEIAGADPRRAASPLHTDAVQAAGALPLDVDRARRAICCRSPATSSTGRRASACSTCAPARRCCRSMQGGGQERRRRAGTENVAGIVGLATALTLAEAERPATSARLAALRDRLAAGLRRAHPRLHRQWPPDRAPAGHVAPSASPAWRARRCCSAGRRGDRRLDRLGLHLRLDRAEPRAAGDGAVRRPGAGSLRLTLGARHDRRRDRARADGLPVAAAHVRAHAPVSARVRAARMWYTLTSWPQRGRLICGDALVSTGVEGQLLQAEVRCPRETDARQ